MMLKKVGFTLVGLSALCFGHFQSVIVSDDIIEGSESKKIEIKYEFFHPFEGHYMEMDAPVSVGVQYDGKKEDLKKSLKSYTVEGKKCYKTEYVFKAPADYIFYIDPKPYFEPAEEKFIRHITKTIVDVAGAGEGWDTPLGVKAEIVPLTRPYGLYAGNLFQGEVLFNGKPVANAEVEVELLNDKGLKAPSDMHVTQVVKTDAKGVFSFVMPKAGYWGFSALLEDEKPLKNSSDGKEYPVEIGAVLWVKVYDYK